MAELVDATDLKSVGGDSVRVRIPPAAFRTLKKEEKMIALGVIDIQNDFAHPKGNLYVKDGEKIVPQVEELLKLARRNKKVVFFSLDIHSNPDPEFEKWPPHCIGGTWGAELFEPLEIEKEDIVIIKGSFQYSAFASGILDLILKERKIKGIILVGLAFDFCVGETALDGIKRDFKVWIVRECSKAVKLENFKDKKNSEKVMEERLKKAGVKLISFKLAKELLSG